MSDRAGHDDQLVFADGQPVRLAESSGEGNVLVDFMAAFGINEATAIEMLAWLDERAPERESASGDYRAAAEKYRAEDIRTLAFIVGHENPRVAAWSVACAKGYNSITDGRSFEAIGRDLGVVRANISKYVKLVQRAFGGSLNGIEPMPGQKSREACGVYRASRLANLIAYTEPKE